MPTYIDLHTHTTASDGSLNPRELIDKAKKLNITYLAITDHDSIDGIFDLKEYSSKLNIKLIAGVEFSFSYKEKDIHLLGYLKKLDFKKDDLLNLAKDLKVLSKKRFDRNIEILRRLNADNYKISFSDLSVNEKQQITRAHFAKALVSKKYCKDISSAFETILYNGSKYIPNKSVSLNDVFNIIKKHEMFSSLAHPFLYNFKEKELRDFLLLLKKENLDAIEVYHSTHNLEYSEFLKKLAKEYSLGITAGSDFHGTPKPKVFLGESYGGQKIEKDLVTSFFID